MPALNEFAKRVLTGLVLAPLTVAAVYAGGAAFALFLAVVAGAAAWELLRMARVGGNPSIAWLGIPGAALVPLLTALHTHGRLGVPVASITLVVLVALTVATFRRDAGPGSEPRPLAAAAVTAFAIVYCGATFSFAYGLRYFPYADGHAAGTALVILPVWLTWSTDTGAYLVGRLVAGPKLAPSISPKKTISGAVGGVATAVFMGWAYSTYVLRPLAQLTLTPDGIVVFAVAIAVAAILGDLAESQLKREAGVKDASGLLPGHGGILDRTDSLTFVLPVAYVLLPAFLKPAPIL